MTKSIKKPALIDALERYAGGGERKPNRAALATLRRGLGRPIGTDLALCRYVDPYLARGLSRRREHASYLTAALFGSHPVTEAGLSVGGALRRIRDLQTAASESVPASLELRVTALLESHPDDLPAKLRHAVSLLRANGVGLDWAKLLKDLTNWDHPDRWVQRRWARDYWGMKATTTTEETT